MAAGVRCREPGARCVHAIAVRLVIQGASIHSAPDSRIPVMLPRTHAPPRQAVRVSSRMPQAPSMSRCLGASTAVAPLLLMYMKEGTILAALHRGSVWRSIPFHALRWPFRAAGNSRPCGKCRTHFTFPPNNHAPRPVVFCHDRVLRSHLNLFGVPRHADRFS